MMMNYNVYQSSLTQSFFKLILCLILPFTIIGCNFPTTKNTFQPDRSQSLTPYSTSFVKVEFNLQVPSPLTKEESIIVVLLDEVTGLPYNRQEYEMDQKDERKYSVILSIPMFSVIKYRYEKVGEVKIVEKNAIQDSVRYRMFFVEDDVTINDSLYSWDKIESSSTTGVFEGVVRDKSTGKSVPDIIISISGQLSFTDSNGFFRFGAIPAGTHNATFYAINGAYQTYQQGATIASGKKTPASITLSPNKAVEVSFLVTPPDDALGAPVYLAGNFSQFGNTFTDLQGSMSIDAERMPILTPRDDGKLSLNATLYAGTDFRYKFTLGDGYWNAELNANNGLTTRQLIVPAKDISLELKIDTWRAPAFEPITFQTVIHPELGYPGERYIQFKKDEWTEPIRLWPLGNGNHLYILYSPFEITNPVSYRICLIKSCGEETTSFFTSEAAQVEPTDRALTRTIEVDQWKSPRTNSSSETINPAVFPYKSSNFKTIVELSPQMSPVWYASIPQVFKELDNMDTEVVIISPLWMQNNNGYLEPEIGTTPFSFELINDISEAQNNGLDVGLFPQLGPLDNKQNSINWRDENTAWRADWFNSYRNFILNYANIAKISNSDYLVIGGKQVLASLPVNNPTYLQAQIEEDWRTLIDDIRDIFDGKLLWATNAGLQMDPLPVFIDLMDEVYISIDSPLASEPSASFDQIAYGFTTVLDNLIYEVYRSTFKPITIALAYPSVNSSVQGCELVDVDCTNDGLFINQELSGLNFNTGQQTEIYNAILPVAASREWITGIAIRGFIPAGNPTDLSSSISGKPAQNVIEYWYKGLNSEY